MLLPSVRFRYTRRNGAVVFGGKLYAATNGITELPAMGRNMVQVGYLIVTLCVFSMVARAQEDPLAWFPLQVGSRWVYEHEWKSGDRNRPDVDRWTTEETITGWVTIPEGLVVLREVKLQSNDLGQGINRYRQSYLIARHREPYLVHGNCVYVIWDGWDGRTRQLRAEFRKYLSEGAVSPDFCFPLETGREWGDVKNDTPWRVQPARDGAGSFLLAQYMGAVHIFSGHFGSGGSGDVWFQKGAGVVGEHYIHNGTYDEYTRKLLSFAR